MTKFSSSGSRRLVVFLVGVSLLAALAVILPGCGKGGKSGNEIRVAVVMPITGREAKPGQNQSEGIELAIKQINDAGGIFVKSKGKKLPIHEIFYDDASDQSKSAGLVERAMTTDEVVAVIGGYSTALGEAESVMPDRYQTPWITPGAAASSIFAHGYQYAFGTLSPSISWATPPPNFSARWWTQGKLKKGLKVAMALGEHRPRRGLRQGYRGLAQQHPGYFNVVFSEKFDLGGTDFSGLLQKVKQPRRTSSLSDAHLQDYITMQRQYIQSGMHHQMISYGARGPEADARKALGDGVDYIFCRHLVVGQAALPAGEEVRRRLPSLHRPQGPDSWYAATAYEAMRALAAAIEQAGSWTRPPSATICASWR